MGFPDILTIHIILVAWTSFAMFVIFPAEEKRIKREALESRLRILEHKRDKMAAYGEELGEVWAEIEAIEHELKEMGK
jgi:hypothetical protein